MLVTQGLPISPPSSRSLWPTSLKEYVNHTVCPSFMNRNSFGSWFTTAPILCCRSHRSQFPSTWNPTLSPWVSIIWLWGWTIELGFMSLVKMASLNPSVVASYTILLLYYLESTRSDFGDWGFHLFSSWHLFLRWLCFHSKPKPLHV